MPKWEHLNGSVTTPLGFRAGAVAAGIKRVPGALDLALIFSDAPATASAGLFTTNRVAAAPVTLSKQNLVASHGRCRAIIANSGNANACTGRDGARVAHETARTVAKLLSIDSAQVLVASTGVIGVPLRAQMLIGQLPALVQKLSRDNGPLAAQAILTTDTVPKVCVMRAEVKGRAVHIAGIAKGSGMIHPRMATMLCFLTTDAAVAPPLLRGALRSAAASSFNCLSVDGDTSTNDSLIMLASGLSQVRAIPQNHTWFLQGLTTVCQTLARMIARDGEGARRLVTIEVRGARTGSDADRVARAIANSPLVKTAIAGADPNWGRIICAAGYSGAQFDPAQADIFVNELCLCRKGLEAGFDESAAHDELDQKEVTLRIDLHAGKANSRLWTCDLTQGYITINASYRT